MDEVIMRHRMEDLFNRWQTMGLRVRDLGGIVQNPFSSSALEELGVEWLEIAERKHAEMGNLIDDTRNFLEGLSTKEVQHVRDRDQKMFM